MTTKERIQAAIETLGEADLHEVYGLIQRLADAQPTPVKVGIMTTLKGIKIDAPSDFSEHLDQYVSGEKRVEDGLH